MKKLLLSLAISAAALTASADGVDWYFVYGGNGWSINETTQFQTTDTPNVYVLKDYALTADADKGGFNYQITNTGWAKMYGWCAEADGNDVPGTWYKLGSVGNAWINCESGTYNIYFNGADETIMFEVVSLGGGETEVNKEWYFVYDGNSWATDETTLFAATETEGVYELKNYTITAPADKGGIGYQITNKSWSKTYGWCEEADGNDTVGSTYKLGAKGNAWLTCECGTYNITFNANDETILFVDAAGVAAVSVAAEQPAEYFNISGMRVSADQLTAGLYIKRQGSTISKVIIR